MNLTTANGPARPGEDAGPSGTGRRCAARRIGAALLTVGLVGAGSQVLLPTAAQAAGPTSVTFNTGATNQLFTVPPGVTQLSVTAIGAAGGGYVESLWPYTNVPNSGGAGAKVTGTLKVSPGQKLYVNVAAVPVNGDGSVGTQIWRWRIPVGGAASDIRTSPTAPLTGSPISDPRLIVAAGGGSVGGEGSAPGGAAGASPAAGTNGTYGSCGGGAGTATAGGTGGAANGCPNPSHPGDSPAVGGNGTAGAGGAGAITPTLGCHDSTNRPAGGMGGSGWFGGGGGGANDYCTPGGGGAGSSYASPTLTSGVTVATDTARDTPQVTVTYTPLPGIPTVDTGGNYTWSNASTLDFPTVFSIPSPQGTHQRSCTTLSGSYFGTATDGYSTAYLQAWNDSSGATAWQQASAGVAHLRLTTDGNLQFVRGTQVAWSSNTAPRPGQPYAMNLKLQTDGNLALYTAAGRYIWDAKVAPACP